MLRAQALAIALDGDDASGWRASIIAAAESQERTDRTVGHGSTQAEAAEDAWNRHAAPRD